MSNFSSKYSNSKCHTPAVPFNRQRRSNSENTAHPIHGDKQHNLQLTYLFLFDF